MKRYLLLLLLPILTYASIGKITVLKGKVTITRDGGDIRAKSGSILEKRDFIQTSKNAKVQIVFTDKTIFTIGKNSTLDIADYLYDEAQPSKNKAKFNVLKGAFTSITGRIGKLNKSKFKLKTKSASIGIRGTIVKANQETIMCTEGAISVTTPNGITMDVEAGSKTSVASGTPSKPETITATDEAEMGADVTKEDKEESEKQVKEEATAEEAKTGEATEADDKEEANEATVTQTEVTDEAEDKGDKALEEANTKISVNANRKTFATDKVNLQTQDETLKIKNDDGTLSDMKNLKSTTDGAMTWGSWDNSDNGGNTEEFFVTGMQSTVEDVNNLGSSASYKGNVQGNVKDKTDDTIDSIANNANNEVQLNFDLGSATKGFTGHINFDTASGEEWRTNIGTGTVTDNSFKSSSVSGSGSNGRAVTSGSVDGSFYGDNANQVGGNFNMATGGHTAEGVFKADKQ